MKILDLLRGYTNPRLVIKDPVYKIEYPVEQHIFSCDGIHFMVTGDVGSAWRKARKLAGKRKIFKIG